MKKQFTYKEFTSRNIGFISPEQQDILRGGSAFVCGVGGMGCACIQSLSRSGIGHLTIADYDEFEISNLNRQVFANIETVGHLKAEVAAREAHKINPDIDLKIYADDWLQNIDSILKRCKIIVNAMDDIRASIYLYRKAKEHKATVVDAYTSPLPSVFCVRPEDHRPEERLGYPSIEKDWKALTEEDIRACLFKEVVFVLTHSTSIKYIALDDAIEVMHQRKIRMSFAPMVIITGNLLSYEVIKFLLKDELLVDEFGYFFNPYSGRTEYPKRNPHAAIRRFIIRNQMRKLFSAT